MTYFRKVPNVNSTVLSNGFTLHLALSEYNTSAILNGHFAELMANNSSMEGPPLSCFHLPDPSFDHVSERYTMNLITAIINIVTASLAVICNLLICAAIIIRLRTPSNLLIASLALSDVFVGLAVQPGYIMYRIMENQRRSVPCFVRILYANAFYICYGVAPMTLATVNYEQFVAVPLRARYNAVFSSIRITKYTAFIWVFNIIFTSLQWAGVNKISKGMHLVAWFTSYRCSGKYGNHFLICAKIETECNLPILTCPNGVKGRGKEKRGWQKVCPSSLGST